MRVSLVNFLFDDSTSVRGAAMESARQTGLRFFRFIEARDRAYDIKSFCSVWTFSDEPLLLAANAGAAEFSDLPLTGNGASMLGRAFSASFQRTSSQIEQLRDSLKLRRSEHPTVRSILISDLESSEEWLSEGFALAQLGRLSLVSVGGGLQRVTPKLELFSVVADASDLTDVEICRMLDLDSP